MKLRNFGLVEGIQDVRDYIFGASSLPQIPLQPDSDWEKFLPWYEPQAENFETNGCVVWGIQNCIETLYKKLYGIEPNYSENFTYLLTPVDPNRGSDPNDVAECIRRAGLIDNTLMRVPDTKEEFLDMDRITGSLRAKGLNWLQQHTFSHEWVWRTRPKNYMAVLKEALKYSPIAVSVSAWNEENGVYVSYGDVNNHCCMLYKFDEEGYPWIFDSYDHSKKKLAKDHNIRRAKRIYISNKKQEQVKSLMGTVIGLLQELYTNLLVKKNMKTLLQVCEENIGIDVTPQDIVSDDVACAEVVTTLVKKVYPKMQLISGTWTLWQYLKPETGWVLCAEPEPECLVLSPTGSVPKSIGHVGIVLKDGVIASNDSKTGKFMKNYTISSWNNYYGKKLKMPVYYYRHK